MRIILGAHRCDRDEEAVTFDQGLPMLDEVLFIPVRAIAADAALYLLAGALPILVGLGGFSL
ncbi:MAG TPA: hypothetical protein VK191_07480, partial [Symbiobacteriaceae bacterium]|nr:hypothetical protein [Symbiobacteriaceae bacterium]